MAETQWQHQLLILSECEVRVCYSELLLTLRLAVGVLFHDSATLLTDPHIYMLCPSCAVIALQSSKKVCVYM